MKADLRGQMPSHWDRVIHTKWSFANGLTGRSSTWQPGEMSGLERTKQPLKGWSEKQGDTCDMVFSNLKNNIQTWKCFLSWAWLRESTLIPAWFLSRPFLGTRDVLFSTSFNRSENCTYVCIYGHAQSHRSLRIPRNETQCSWVYEPRHS